MPEQNSLNYWLQKAFEQAQANIMFRAKLGDGRGNLLVYDQAGNRRYGYVYAMINFESGAAEVATVLCLKTPQEYGLDVWVTFSPEKELEVVGTQVETASQYTGGREASTGPHAWTHGIYGPDPIAVEGRHFLPLLTHPNNDGTDLNVQVEPGFHLYNGVQTFFVGETVDLSGELPASGQLCVVLTLNQATNSIDINATGLTGTNPPTATIGNWRTVWPFSRSDIAGVSISGIWLAAVRLFVGQTSIEWVDIQDLRVWGGVATPTPTDVSGPLYLAWRGMQP